MELLSALVATIGTGGTLLLKEIGKGGGGSTEEPTVCMVLVPLGLGVAWSVIGSLRRRRATAPGAAA